MGQSPSLLAQIEIAASPTKVRSVFLDFPQYPSWCKWTISILDPSTGKPTTTTKTPHDLVPEKDKLAVDIGGFAFTPIFIDNSPDQFAWEGRSFIFTGRHHFLFKPSQERGNEGGTTMVQYEDFSGLLAFLMGEGVVARWVGLRKQSVEKWEGWLRDLKGECERRGVA